MMTFLKSPATEVQEILDLQRKALLAGELDVLERSAPDLQKALARLHAHGATHDVAQQLKESASYNARLLKAAQHGVNQIKERLGAVRNTPLSTYDASGQRNATIPTASRTLARR